MPDGADDRRTIGRESADAPPGRFLSLAEQSAIVPTLAVGSSIDLTPRQGVIRVRKSVAQGMQSSPQAGLFGLCL